MFKCGFKSISTETNTFVKVMKITMWVVIGIIGFAGLALLIGIALQALWNWLMPTLFNLPVITYWQAVGLMVLSKILLGGFNSAHSHSSSSGKKNKPQEIHHHHYPDGSTTTEEI